MIYYNVLITSIGSNTSIGVAKSLRNQKGIKLIGLDTNVSSECPGVTFVDVFYQGVEFSDEKYIKLVEQIVIEEEINCIIPIFDGEIEVLAREKTKDGSLASILAVNLFKAVSLSNNKVLLNEKLKTLLPVPNSYNKCSEINYPAILKPINGVSSRGIKILNSKADITKIETGYFCQDFIKGKEYTVDCYTSYVEPDIFLYSVRERIETKSGMSTKGKILDVPILGEYCRKIHHYLNYKGTSNIQFIEERGIYYFIEINPRFAGGGILTYRSGYNMPWFTVYEIVNKKVLSNEQELKFGNQMTRHWEETIFDKNGTII